MLATSYPSPPTLGMPPATRRASLLPAIRFDALARIKRVCRALGQQVCDLLRACLVDDLSWTKLGACLHVDARTARAWVILAIKALAQLEKSSLT